MPEASADAAFDVVLKDGERIHVPADTSILDALEAAGIVIASVCKEGICGTCETPFTSGMVEHRDQIMTSDEHKTAKTMMICVSRCTSGELHLDLCGGDDARRGHAAAVLRSSRQPDQGRDQPLDLLRS